MRQNSVGGAVKNDGTVPVRENADDVEEQLRLLRQNSDNLVGAESGNLATKLATLRKSLETLKNVQQLSQIQMKKK